MAEQHIDTTGTTGTPLMVQAVAAALVGFGVVLLALGVAYLRDLDQLRRTPEMVWLFVCGIPQPTDTLTAPLLLGSGAAGLLLGIGVVGVTRLRLLRHP
jgi:hypothetical protein